MKPTLDPKALLAAATPGPWTAHPGYRDEGIHLQLGAPPEPHWSAWIPSPARGDLALLLAAPDLARELLVMRLAFDAIARALDPAGGCTDRCASASDSGEDCDCGYIEAGDDPAAFARAALRGEWPS